MGFKFINLAPAPVEKKPLHVANGKVTEVKPEDLQTDMQHVSVVKMLVKTMGGYFPERSHKTVHASDVTKEDFCPRQFRLLDHYGLERPKEYLPPAQKATFDVGRATADLFCNEWAGKAAVGPWKCRACEHVQTQWSSKPQSNCPSCGRRSWTYHEPVFVEQSSKISGSIDVMLEVGHPKLLMGELKIMKGEAYNALAAPLAEHKLRTQLYLRLIEGSHNPHRVRVNTQEARILYVSREFGKKDPSTNMIMPVKEFRVVRDDAATDEYFSRGKEVHDARQSGSIPSHRICPHVGCKTAKECPVRAQCWGDQ